MTVSIESFEVLGLLNALVDKSLVVYEQDERGQGRYRLLETVRQYSRERLMDSGDGDNFRRRHKDFYLALALEARKELLGPEQPQWLRILETEHDNYRAALDYCRNDSQSGVDGVSLAIILERLWNIRGYWSEGRAHLAALLALPEVQEPTKVRAVALNAAGLLATVQGDWDNAQALMEESLAIERTLGNQQSIGNTLGNLGLIAKDQGDYVRARLLSEQSLAIKRETGDLTGQASSINTLGIIAYDQGDYATARARYEESLALQQEQGHRRGIAIALLNLGNVVREQGDVVSALAYTREGILGMQELGDRLGIAFCLGSLAELARAQGQEERACRLFAAHDALREALGAPMPEQYRFGYDRYLAELRADLGEDAFQTAIAAGRALSLEEAIEYALSEEAPT